MLGSLELIVLVLILGVLLAFIIKKIKSKIK